MKHISLRVDKFVLFGIVLVGGMAVIASYIYGAQTVPNAGDILWGGVPETLRPFYTVGMFLAASGYFAVIFFLLFHLDLNSSRIAGRYGGGLFNWILIGILFPSALWMPLTIRAIGPGSPESSWLVRIALWVVAAASLCLLIALITLEPPPAEMGYRMAVLGSILFSLHTVILDAIVWVIFWI